MNYTNEQNQIVFLKDADIVSEYNETSAGTISSSIVSANGVPSFDLYKSEISAIRSNADNLSGEIKLSVNTLLSGNITYTGKNTYTDCVDINMLSAKALSASDTYVEDLSSTNLSVENAQFGVVNADKLSVKTDLSTSQFYLDNMKRASEGSPLTGTSIAIDGSGISAVLSGENKDIRLSTANGINSIFVNDRNFAEHIHDKISTDFTGFAYVSADHRIDITIADRTLSIDTVDFIRNRAITHVNTYIDVAEDQKYLALWLTLQDEEGHSWEIYDWNPLHTNGKAKYGYDYANINIQELTQVYRFSNGLSSDGNLNVVAVPGIARLSDLICGDAFNDDTRRGYAISSLSESDGKIEYGIYRLTSSDIEGLEGFVKDEISSLCSDICATTALCVNDLQDQISANDNELSDLSAQLSAEVIRNLSAVRYQGDLTYTEGDISLTSFLNRNFGSDKEYLFRLGNMYRFADTSAFISDDNESRIFEKNDYIIFKNPVVLSDAMLSDMTFINDYDKEIERLSAVSTGVLSGISAYLSDEISANFDRISSLQEDVQTISGDLSTKIWIKNPGTAYNDGKFDDLSVVKLGINEYHSKLIGSDLCDNVLYVVSADYIEAYGQVISNLTMTADKTASEAATQHYVDNKITATRSELTGLVQTVSTDITGQIDTISDDFEARIAENTKNIAEISNSVITDDDSLSAKFCDLSGHYHKTFTEKEYTSGTDTKVDVLNITDSQNIDKKYTLEFLNGTLVLVPVK